MKAKSKPLFALFSLSAVLALGACKKGDDEEDTPKKKAASATAAATQAPATAPAASTPAKVVPDTPPPATSGIAKSELDGREPDAGWAGGSLAVGKISFVTDKTWGAPKSGDFTAASSADSGFTAGKYPDGAAPTGSLDAATKALGLTDCAWGAADNISLGKDHLPAQAADGTCKKGGQSVKAIWAATSGKDQDVLAVGEWQDGKDNKGVLNTFRSAKSASGGGGDATGIAACCAALQSNSVNAPLQYKGMYIAAAGACQGLIHNPQGRQALATIRGMLAGAGVPPACK